MFRIGKEEINAVADAINERILFKTNGDIYQRTETKMNEIFGSQ